MSIAAANSIESRIPHDPSTALTKTRAHAASERSNDHETIMATVSNWDSNFVVLTPLPDGEFEFKSWLTPDDVDAFYVSSLSRQDTLEQFGVSELNAPWFQFTEALGNLRYHDDGEIHQVHVAVLFPVWTDGILGEICWKAPEWAIAPFGSQDRLELTERLSAFEAGWLTGDVSAMAATFGDSAHAAIRTVAVDGDHRSRAIVNTKDELVAAWSAPEAGRILELERIHHQITNWYVFASYRMLIEVGGRKVVRETARVLPVDAEGRFIGELSYSMEADS